MKAIELTAEVGRDRHMHLELPAGTPSGPARVLVLIPDSDDAEAAWGDGVAREWRRELMDARQDIYSLDDGEPVP